MQGNGVYPGRGNLPWTKASELGTAWSSPCPWPVGNLSSLLELAVGGQDNPEGGSLWGKPRLRTESSSGGGPSPLPHGCGSWSQWENPWLVPGVVPIVPSVLERV